MTDPGPPPVTSPSDAYHPAGDTVDNNVTNPETLFRNGLDLNNADRHIINKYVIYVLDQWAASNSEDYALWEGIQMEFSSWTQDRLNQISCPT